MEHKKLHVKIIATIIVLLFVAVLLFCGLGIQPQGQSLPSELTIAEGALKYGVYVEDRFFKAFRMLFSGVASENILIDGMIANIFSAFSFARIPTEKVEWFLGKVEEVPTDENPIFIYLTEKMEIYEDLMKKYEESLPTESPLPEPSYHDVFTAKELQTGIKESFLFILSSPLTNDEMGRLFYRMILLYTEGSSYATLIKTIGERDISMLTVGSYMVFKNAGVLAEATTLGAARAVGQSLVSIGSSYLSLIKRIGLSEVDRLFGFDYRIAEDETSGLITGEFIPYYNNLLDSLQGFPSGSLLLAGHILTSMNETAFDEIYLAEVAKKDGNDALYKAHRVYAAAELAKSVRKGIDSATKNSEKLYETDKEIVELLAKGYSAGYELTDIMDGNLKNLQDRSHYEAYANSLKVSTNALLSSVEKLGKLGTYADVLRLQQQNIAEFDARLADAEALFAFRLEDMDGVTDLFAGLLFNTFVRLLQLK